VEPEPKVIAVFGEEETAAATPGCSRTAARPRAAQVSAFRPDQRGEALGRERQKALLHIAIDHVVAERHEVDGLGLHDLLEAAMAPALGGGDADVAHASLRLHLLQRLDVSAPVEQVVDLHEIEPLDAPVFAGGLHLVHAERLEQGPHLAGGKESGPILDAREAVADYRFGRPIHGRGIDQAPAAVEEGLHHLRTRGAQPFVIADIKGDPGSQANGGNLLARGWDRLLQNGP